MNTLKIGAKTPNPRKNASILSKLTFWYMNDLFLKGKKERLQVSDMFTTLESLSSVVVAENAKREWEKEREKRKETGKSPSILLSFVKANKKAIIVQGLGQLLEEANVIVSAYMVGFLIEYFTLERTVSRNAAIAYATVIALLVIIKFIYLHTVEYQLECIGLKLRTSVCSLVYEKVTSLSQGAFTKTSAGNIVNLVSSDAHKLLMAMFFFNYLWIAPLKLAVVTGLLCMLLGVSALPGIALLVLFMILQLVIGKSFRKLRKKIGELTDNRVKVTSELLKGMRAVKMYTWEGPLGSIIKTARSKEINKLLKSQLLKAVNVSTFVCMPYVTAAIMFTTHFLRGETFTTGTVFSTLALLNLLKYTIGIFLPLGVQGISQAGASSKRLETFLELEENLTRNVTSKPLSEKEPDAYVNFSTVSASWKNEKDAVTLKNISFHVDEEKSLLMVVGPVGAGKTSLLMAIIKEMPVVDGSITTNGSIAYASQKPWIFSGTVRQNILFGQKFDAKRYEKTIKACALNVDFDAFEKGDLTLVGERGVCISGGQKARISLARAVYRDADVYILDDPLSAVDAEVGKHIFHKCICGLLKNKVRILTTHQIQYLKSASQILCIEEGRIVKLGTYEEIMHSNFDVQSILSDNIEIELDEKTAAKSDRPTYFKRSASIVSTKSDLADAFREDMDENIFVDEDGKDIDEHEEKSKEGTIGFSLYFHYFRSGGGFFLTVLTVFAVILNQLSLTGVDWWLAVWANAEEAKSKNVSMTSDVFKYYLHGNEYDNLYVYLGWVAISCCVVFSSVILFYWLAINSSRILHNEMLQAILKAPMYFFDTTPTGRILNRFAKDTFFLDEELPWTFHDFMMYSVFSINAVVVSCVNLPYMLVVMVVLVIAFAYLRSYFLATARNVKRLEGISRSPMFAHLSSTLEGLPTIRSSNAVDIVIKEYYDCQDHQADGWYLFVSISRWFAQRLDALVAIFIAFAVYLPLVVVEFTNVDPTLVGLSLVFDLQLCILFQWCVRQSAQVESLMTSAERVFEYCELEPERDVETKKSIDKNWPRSGDIKANKAAFAYHETLPMILKDINFHIQEGEKIGIVGRTGAGKSTILSALFRTGILSGEICIDGASASDVSLHDWRKSFSVIPQDPVLFTGSLRVNIDPFSEFEDIDVWDVLEQVNLKDVVVERNEGLSTIVSEGGSNFSVGQRQLLCLARALLLKKKILLVDEATANVDNDTDTLIQETIREKFRDCTVITIAHRLHTLMDSDRIMVMNNGQIVQFDEPSKLFENKDGQFYKLVQQTGEEEAAHLETMANEAKEVKTLENFCIDKVESKDHDVISNSSKNEAFVIED